MNKNIPKGWTLIPFQYVQPSTKRFDPTQEDNQMYVGLEHIEKDTGRIIGSSNSKTTVSQKTVFKKGDLLYGKLRPYLNKVAIPNFDGVCSTDILVFPKNPFIINTLLKFYLLKSDFVRFANSTITGVQHPRTSHKKLSSHLIPIPPLNEQHRIVAKIESVFAQIDTCRRKLKGLALQSRSAPGSLMQLRSSVLRQAFEGKLVPQDFKDEPADVLLKKINSKRISYKKTNFPLGWVRTRIEHVCTLPQYGWTTSAQKDGNLHLLRTTDITTKHVDWNSVPYCKSEPSDVTKYLLHDGDIVISRAGSVGFSYLINKPERSIFASYLIRFKPLINKHFFAYFLNSDLYWKEISARSVGIALANVNATKLKQIPIPVPPLNEQKRIVSRIESIFARIDAMDTSIKSTLQLLDMLKSSTLKQAFEGKLVPQDPNDEPATKLLEQIQHRKAKDVW